MNTIMGINGKSKWMLETIAAALLLVSTSAFAETPRSEHPRPDAFRENWMTLNGEWQFAIDKAGDGEERGLISGKDLGSKIIVPFCPESKLSGLSIGNTDYFKNVWYRKNFDLPAAMKGKRILIHFGAVDYKTWVYVNGALAGTHTGDNAAFGFDVTKFLKDGSNEVVVRVFDDLRSGLQPGGKAGFRQERRLRLHTNHGHLADCLGRGGWLVLCGKYFRRARSRSQPRVDRGAG